MADKPIIFSAPMVRALLDGAKTQTRRVLTHSCEEAPAFVGQGIITALDEKDRPYRWPRSYATGDRLYVREAATWVSAWGWRYRADNDDLTEKREAGEVGKWRPSIHMPRWASRLTLTVTDVRVERLQEISEADAVAEGGDPVQARMYPELGTCRHWFSDLWNSINGPDAWDANPWVAAYTFTVQRGNVDQLEAPHA